MEDWCLEQLPKVYILPKWSSEWSNEWWKQQNNYHYTKILFIGSSQTWGAGASTTENTFVHRFENLVNAHDTTESVTCINTGISGLTSTELFKFYQEKWISAAPKVVIINLIHLF